MNKVKRRTVTITRIDAIKPDQVAAQPFSVLLKQHIGLHCTNPGAVSVHAKKKIAENFENSTKVYTFEVFKNEMK